MALGLETAILVQRDDKTGDDKREEDACQAEECE
jgi:hypothetical protein